MQLRVIGDFCSECGTHLVDRDYVRGTEIVPLIHQCMLYAPSCEEEEEKAGHQVTETILPAVAKIT